MGPPPSPGALAGACKILPSSKRPIGQRNKLKRSFPLIVPITISPTKDTPTSPIPDYFQLDNLPDEMLEEVSKCLSVPELKFLRLTSRHMYRVSLRAYARNAFGAISTDFSEDSLARILSILKDDLFRPQIREITVRWSEVDRTGDKAVIEAFYDAFTRFENCKMSAACRFFLLLRSHY
ncbi:uncharacterized protein N7511_006454 [Penicillium nucicola]|uniref:uncharacterized protein n=1 Tax=Penicillium nucicola TaxID=1850975 RepID=UPI002544FF72|nr:uncharacterized protein N7511_006454 [Penicillium nucicola]KAJ5757760.1 hypothetical protein N7511_006454 [Penicillium nucicola]